MSQQNESLLTCAQALSSVRGTSQEEDNLSDSGHNSMNSLPPYRPPFRPHLSHIRLAVTLLSLIVLVWFVDVLTSLVYNQRIYGSHKHHRLLGTGKSCAKGIRGQWCAHRGEGMSEYGYA